MKLAILAGAAALALAAPVMAHELERGERSDAARAE